MIPKPDKEQLERQIKYYEEEIEKSQQDLQGNLWFSWLKALTDEQKKELETVINAYTNLRDNCKKQLEELTNPTSSPSVITQMLQSASIDLKPEHLEQNLECDNNNQEKNTQAPSALPSLQSSIATTNTTPDFSDVLIQPAPTSSVPPDVTSIEDMFVPLTDDVNEETQTNEREEPEGFVLIN